MKNLIRKLVDMNNTNVLIHENYEFNTLEIGPHSIREQVPALNELATGWDELWWGDGRNLVLENICDQMQLK